jgi:ABC-type dipeptide/oligopeptide/nickel transport system ATPase subunit
LDGLAVGESGSGKTTLARIILGLQTADAGDVDVDGTAVDPHNPRTLFVGLTLMVDT